MLGLAFELAVLAVRRRSEAIASPPPPPPAGVLDFGLPEAAAFLILLEEI